MKRLISLFTLLALFSAAALTQVTAPRSSEIAQGVGGSGDWYALALLQGGEDTDLSQYVQALLAYAAGSPSQSASTRQRTALLLNACGFADDPYAVDTPAATIGKQGIMSLIFGLHLLNNGFSCDGHDPEEIVCMLLALEKDGGGWAVSGSYADADVTSMALQALAPYYDQNAEVAAASERALAFLSRIQTENGGFCSYGRENAESAAQVVIALTALRIDPRTDPRFLKNGLSALDAIRTYITPEGEVTHLPGGEPSEMARAQVFLAGTALWRFDRGKGSVFLLDERETVGIPTSGEEPGAQTGGYKTIAVIAILVLAAAVCLLLRLRGKKNYKSYLLALLLALVICAAVLLIEIRSPGQYYSGSDGNGVGPAVGKVTVAISCEAVAGKEEHVPRDGWILRETELDLYNGETVYDVLSRCARNNGLLLQADGPSAGKYLRGINNIGEFDFGDLSGWTYRVNGETPSVSCSAYELQDGDSVLWVYTLELGKDIP